MFWFIAGIIVGIICLIGLAVAVFSDNDSDKIGGAITAGIAGLLSFGLLFASATREVPARSIGVPVTVGHIGTAMSPGLHYFQPPWEKVNLLNERIQTMYFDGRDYTHPGTALPVRIGGQQLAYWQGSIQFKVLDNAAPGLFSNYGNTGDIMQEIKSAVITRNLQGALTHIFQDYNPIVDVSVNLTAGNSQFSKFQVPLLSDLNHLIGGRVRIDSLIMKNMIYTPDTQANLERVQQQFGKTAVAQELIKTNTELNVANGRLSAKSLSPGVLANLCYQTTQEAITNRYSLPVGWNCTGSASLALSGK